MDLRVLKLQEPVPKPPQGERRRRVRHKLHTPVYASFSGPHTGMVLDLSELLDVNEDGFAVQTSEPLEVNRPLNICLDLPETKKYIHATGHVAWSDGKGRGGIRFSAMADESRRQLKESLLVNVLIACVHRTARAEQLSQRAEEKPHEAPPVVDSSLPAPVPDLSGVLSAVEAVSRESRALSGNFDAVLQLITERALSLTGADGSALAFMTEGDLICRARAGKPAPPLGARVDSTKGLTGECVRSAQLISCEDADTDPRVDREICRALGIASILAAPIVSDFRVVGLIEVFSSRPRAFTKIHETALDRLIDILPKTSPQPPTTKSSPTGELLPAKSVTISPTRSAVEVASETETEVQEPLTGMGVRRLHLALLVVVVACAALALGYVLAPTIERHWLSKTDERPTVVAASEVAPLNSSTPVTGNSISRLTTLAESGDAGAQYELGYRYHKGDGVTQSDPEAVKWFLRAAEQGHVVSQAMLGYFYWVGQGVPQNTNEAYFWAVLARAGGDEASKYRVNSIASQMTKAQAAAIQQRAEDWLHDHTGNPPRKPK